VPIRTDPDVKTYTKTFERTYFKCPECGEEQEYREGMKRCFKCNQINSRKEREEKNKRLHKEISDKIVGAVIIDFAFESPNYPDKNELDCIDIKKMVKHIIFRRVDMMGNII